MGNKRDGLSLCGEETSTLIRASFFVEARSPHLFIGGSMSRGKRYHYFPFPSKKGFILLT
jgi:hypothetical protein